MSRSHNNQLNMVSLFDEEPPRPSRKHRRNMPPCHSKNLAEHDGPIDTYRGPEVDNSYVNYAFVRDLHQRGEYHAMHGQAPPVAPVKVEEGVVSVSNTPTYDSDYVESDRDDRRPSKIPKINKDGEPRKPRQPRPKLLKWSDNDWKNVVLGIVWACGETGVQIPFDQAAQVVGDSCTAGALQQAILKLRGKQIDEGYQIPSLRMAWTRKNKRASSSSSSANAKPQQMIGQDPMVQPRPSLVVKLKVPVPKPVVVNNGEAVNTQFNGGLIGTHVNGFEVQFPKADSTIYETTQGIGIISGHPSDPGYPGGHPNLVKPAIATQYHQSTGMSYDFEEHLKHMEEHNFEEDLRDIEEYDFVEDGSQENLLASSSSDTGRPTSFEKARRVFTRYMHLRPRSKNSRVPFRYILEKKRNL